MSKIKPQTNPPRSKLYWAGYTAANSAGFTSFMLAGPKLGLWTTLPGCGPKSGCNAITNGPLGNIALGGFLWPVSFVGVAWFVAMFWLWCRTNGTSRSMLWLIRLGVIGSVGFLVAMLVEGHLCKWCALVHFCNFVFLICAELRIRSAQELYSANIVKRFVFYFVSASVVLGVVYIVATSKKESIDKLAMEQNTKKIVEGVADISTLSLLETDHRFGRADAPVQIVMFTDYQCPDCKRLEAQLAQIYEQRDDLSISVKHFPLNYDCNDQIGKMKMHGNACWAARAAEAAFILGGEGGWQRMHAWLFENGGSFTDATFSRDLVGLGFDPKEFVVVMTGKETMRLVKEDTVDGEGLGIWFTPMIFINGVEYLWYYGGQDSLARVIDAKAVAVSSGVSKIVPPPSAVEKLVADWRALEKRTFAEQGRMSWVGDGDVEIVVWGDYQTEPTVNLDTLIREVVASDSRAKYSFRHFPIDGDCNGGVTKYRNKYPGSCSMAKVIEAVDVLCGSGARWKLHAIFMNGGIDTSKLSLAEIASGVCGEDVQTIISVANSQDVENRIRSDIRAKVSVWGRSVPVLVVDGRFVPRWEIEGTTGMETLLQLIEESSK